MQTFFFFGDPEPGAKTASVTVINSAPMPFRQFPRRLFSGLLLLALLMQTLLPAVAGVRGGSESRLIEVCAASGIKWVKLDPAQSSAPHAAGDHCMLCAATGAMPGFDAGRFLRAELTTERPQPALISVAFAFPGHALRSRAPPSLS